MIPRDGFADNRQGIIDCEAIYVASRATPQWWARHFPAGDIATTAAAEATPASSKAGANPGTCELRL